MRVRDIALEAHVGTSSVMRLIHKMGYDSYTDFKEYIIDKKELEKGSSNTAIPFSLDIFSNDIEQRWIIWHIESLKVTISFLQE